jgi:hypothetical protein
VLARRVGDAATRIAGIEGLHRLQIDGDVLTFEYERDRQAAAALLAQLISAGLPVAEFHALEPDLEQAYLRSGIGQVD